MKNEVNLLVKHAVDFLLCGFVFWIVGFGMVVGDSINTHGNTIAYS
jgi:ammonia channel protein AmtB